MANNGYGTQVVGIKELSKLADSFPAKHNLQLATKYLGFKYAKATNIKEDCQGKSFETNLEYFIQYTNRISAQVANVRDKLIQVLDEISSEEGWIAANDYDFLRLPA